MDEWIPACAGMTAGGADGSEERDDSEDAGRRFN